MCCVVWIAFVSPRGVVKFYAWAPEDCCYGARLAGQGGPLPSQKLRVLFDEVT